MQIDITPTLERLIAKHMAEGCFASPTEVLEYALFILNDAERPFYDNKEAVDRALEEGLASGRAVPLDIEDIKRRGRERLKRGK